MSFSALKLPSALSSALCKSIPPALLEASNAADSPHSTSPEQTLRVTTVSSVSIPLEDTSAASPANPSTLQHRTFEVTPPDSILSAFEFTIAPVSLVVQSLQLPSTQRLQYLAPRRFGILLVNRASSSLVPHLPHSCSPCPLLLPSILSSIHFNFMFSLVTAAALVSALVNISKTLPTHTQNIWSKNKDLGNTQYSGLSSDNITRWPRIAQQMAHPTHLIFDPGGFAFTLTTPKDIRQRKLKTRGLPLRIITMRNPAVITHPFSTISFFSLLKPQFFFSFSSLTEDSQDFNPPGGVTPACALGSKLYFWISITLPQCPSAFYLLVPLI
jgi:hypothetical protein